MVTGDIVCDPDEWRVEEVGKEHAPLLVRDLALPRMRLVSRRDPDGTWTPWVLEAESAALRKAGVTAYGLYALQPLKGPRTPPPRALSSRKTMGTRVGTYGGRVLGTFEDIDAPTAKARIEAWAAQRDSLLAMIVRPGEHTSIVDGCGGPPPLLHRINDAHGLAGARNNLRFNGKGTFYASRDVPAAQWQSASRLADIAASELLVSYGRVHYWRLHRLRIARERPAVPLRPRCESPVAVPCWLDRESRETLLLHPLLVPVVVGKKRKAESAADP